MERKNEKENYGKTNFMVGCLFCDLNFIIYHNNLVHASTFLLISDNLIIRAIDPLLFACRITRYLIPDTTQIIGQSDKRDKR